MAEEVQSVDVDMEDADVNEDDAPPSDPDRHRDEQSEAPEDESSEEEAPVDLMVTTRARRTNAGNRMSTLLAKSAEEDQWGEDWEDAPNEEEFKGGDVNEAEDYNMDSSSSEEDEGADDDDEGEKELRKAERRDKTKKRKIATNPFTARVAAAARKKVKLDLPRTQSPTLAPPRQKKKSERASWIPTEEDGPVRASSRKQTIANKDATLSKLKEKDRRRDDTLAMMKAAEARKEKAKEKPLTQTERLAEAARNERINKKTLHRWEEAEEARAAERQSKIDALKNREIAGPFYRHWSGPAIWVDDTLKYTGKDTPSLECLEEKFNKSFLTTGLQTAQPDSMEADPIKPKTEQTPTKPNLEETTRPSYDSQENFQASMSTSHMPTIPTSTSPQQQTSQMPWTAASQGGDVFMGSHGMSLPSSIMFAPPSQNSFLFGIDQYAQNQPSQSTPADELPPNPFTQASPYQQQYPISNAPFPQSHPSLSDPLLTQPGSNINSQALLLQFQKPPPPPLPPASPKRKVLQRALRKLLILASFTDLDDPVPSSRAKSAVALTKDKDRSALIQLSSTLFGWSMTDTTAMVNAMLNPPPKSKKEKQKEKEAAAAAAAGPGDHRKRNTIPAEWEDLLDDPAPPPPDPNAILCAVTNSVAKYRDPETGIAYRDARAFGVLRGVVGGGFVWTGELGCYVGGRARPLEKMGGKGFLGMPPAKGVPRRFGDVGGGRKVVKMGGVGALGEISHNATPVAGDAGVGVDEAAEKEKGMEGAMVKNEASVSG